MLRDAEYFKTKIGGLEGSGDVGDYLVNLVKEKDIPKSSTNAVNGNGNGKVESGGEGKVNGNKEVVK